MDPRVKKLMAEKKWRQAADILRADLEKNPFNVDARFHFAFALCGGGQKTEALNHYLAVLGLEPKHFAARNNLGNLLLSQGQADLGADCFRKVLEINPDHANALMMLGLFLANTGEKKEAVVLLRRAIKQNQNLDNVYSVLGGVLADLGHFDEGAEAYRKSIDQKPRGLNHNNLGDVYLKQGRPKEAERQFRAALEYENGPTAASIHSNIVMTAHFIDEHDESALAAELSSWANRHEAPLRAKPRPFANSAEPDRRLRVGYLSADFCRHPVGFFWLPVLKSHDPDRFESFCYSSTAKPDNETEKFKAAAMNWRDVTSVPHAPLAERIRQDGIDILVDLSGHTAKNRLLVLARRAAPVQIVAGGHFCSTGMTEVDYLVADGTHAPEGSEREFSEQLIRLPDSYVCYAPSSCAPPITDLPAGGGNPITFGSFNRLSKISPRIVGLWARVLEAVPSSRFLLRAKALCDPGTAALCRKWFEDCGIDGTRIFIGPGAAHENFLGAYNSLDISLDTFPYSGGLTTLEALWMGVPVVTLPGKSFCGRHSASHLSVAGLPELIAKSPEEFVEIARDLANDRDRLAGLRNSMRDRMRASPLLDGKAYTHHLEAAYRKTWQTWCSALDAAPGNRNASNRANQ